MTRCAPASPGDQPPGAAFLYLYLEDPAVAEKMRARDPGLDALLRATITVFGTTPFPLPPKRRRWCGRCRMRTSRPRCSGCARASTTPPRTWCPPGPWTGGTAVRGQHRDVPGPRTGAEALVPAGRHAAGHGNRNHRFRPTAGEGRSVLGRLVEFLYNAVVEVDVANQEPHTRDAAFNGTAPVSPARSERAP